MKPLARPLFIIQGLLSYAITSSHFIICVPAHTNLSDGVNTRAIRHPRFILCPVNDLTF